MSNLIFCLLWLVLPAQSLDGEDTVQQMPVVRATSTVVDLQIDDGPIMKGAWHLDSTVNPDVFRIGSALPYGTKKITFKSDIDSISFDVEAGNEYDFVFLLNDDTKCHTRIWASSNPAVWNLRLLIPICIGMVALLLSVLWNWNSIAAKPLLYCGIAAPICFWVITFISSSIRGDYDHFENVISQLGEIGSGAEVFSSIAFVVVGGLCFLFSIGFYKSSKLFGVVTLPAILSLSMPAMMCWAAIFPLRNDLHGLLGPLPLAMNVGAILVLILWRKHAQLVTIRSWSAISLFFMMLLFLIFVGPLAQHYEGLIQRFWYIGWSIWCVSLSLGLLSLDSEAAPSTAIQ